MKSIILKAKKAVYSSQIGLFQAPRSGEGYDFFDLEPYDFTSDAKRIHWPSYAKTRELYTKIFSKEERKNILLLPILSGSLHFGSTRLKSETLLEALAILAYSAFRYKEQLFIFDRQIKHIYELDLYLEKLANTPLLGKTTTLNYLKNNTPHLTIVIGDFLEPLDLGFLAARDDLVALIVRDTLETSQVIEARANLVDTVSLSQKSANLASSMPTYHEKIAMALAKELDRFRSLGVEWLELFEYEDVFTKLALFFRSR